MSCFQKAFNWLFYKKGTDPLPMAIIFLLSVQYFLESATTASVFSYLPHLVKSFGTSEEQAGKDVGWIASSLFIARVFFGLLWGYLLDKMDPKTVLLISGIFQTISTVLFGFSTSFYWTLVTRFMQGVFKVAGLAAKVIVIHNTNDTNIAVAFAILFNSEALGNIVGPSFSGFLVFLVEQYPKNFHKGGLFDQFKIVLPNVIFTIYLAISTLAIFIYLPSSCSNRKQIIDPVKVICDESSQSSNENLYFNISYDQTLYQRSTISEKTKLVPKTKNGIIHRVTQRLITFKFVQIFMDKGCLKTMIVYAIFGMIAIGYIELFIIFAATSAEFEGLSMSSSHIGLLLMICAVIDVIGSVTISPKIVQKFGAKTAFIYWIIGCGCIYSFVPALVLITNNGIRWFSLVTCLGAINIFISGCFITVNIFVSNSVLPELQGTFTGLAMSVSCIGRLTNVRKASFCQCWNIIEM
ncbi:uncharacterized protein LOC124806378 isoform X3 [Hydra vulgaris]|uniref:uncharacterized protein LOC124806378 isoform X3 n=1 Tax=Hydra vulgaris TaxID=6087 RepID=UPI0032E9C9A5